MYLNFDVKINHLQITMKKKLLLCTLIICAATFGIIASKQEKTESLLISATIEALSQNEGGVSNTGPAEQTKCIGGGHRMVCRCINSQPCTGTDCY